MKILIFNDFENFKIGEIYTIFSSEKRNNETIFYLDEKNLLGIRKKIDTRNKDKFIRILNESCWIPINKYEDLDKCGVQTENTLFYIENINKDDMKVSDFMMGNYCIIDKNFPRETVLKLLSCFGFNIQLND